MDPGPADERLRSVFEREHARLWRSLLAHTGDAEVASDAVAEAFAQAVRRGDALRDPAAWVWRAAFRIAGGELAAPHRRDQHDTPPTRSVDSLPDEVVALLDALARLDDPDRRVVVLCLVGGLSAAEAGGLVGKSAGAVRVRLHRARRRLRYALNADDAAEPTGRGRNP